MQNMSQTGNEVQKFTKTDVGAEQELNIHIGVHLLECNSARVGIQYVMLILIKCK